MMSQVKEVLYKADLKMQRKKPDKLTEGGLKVSISKEKTQKGRIKWNPRKTSHRS